jgi:hypothetical protein
MFEAIAVLHEELQNVEGAVFQAEEDALCIQHMYT